MSKSVYEIKKEHALKNLEVALEFNDLDKYVGGAPIY